MLKAKATTRAKKKKIELTTSSGYIYMMLKFAVQPDY